MSGGIGRLYNDWEEWAATADQRDEGWQEDYPRWRLLMDAAAQKMTQPSPSPEDVDYIDKCWGISEEGECLADYARAHVERCWNVLCLLTESKRSDTRWQAYDVLSGAGRKVETLLRKGLSDPDDYCRRRALLSLARLSPTDAKEIADRFSRHEDPYIRQASISMSAASKDAAFMDRFARRLANDPAWHVRKAALESAVS